MEELMTFPTQPADYEGSEEEWKGYCERKMNLSGYICLAVMPGEEWYTGLVENSFSMGVSNKATQFFWSGIGYDNIFRQPHEIDGWRDAKCRADRFEKEYRGANVFIFNARDEELLPVSLDWDKWILASRRDISKLSGVKDKYHARNIPFILDTSKPFVH